MNKLKLYNTLSRKKEEFKPIKQGKVGLYTCGPTVYNYAHIGNLRAYVAADILARVLQYNDYKLKWAMNITDVDDKTIRDSKVKYPDMAPMEALKKFTKEYEKYFVNDIESLNINMPNMMPRAADDKYVQKMQVLIKRIFEKGYAYTKDGSVYFDIKKYTENYDYGKLVNIDMDMFKAGTRIDSDEYEKENIQDFVLWKGQKEGEPIWDFELNNEKLPGRPGWHIECSAMGEADLGCPFDIHTGGIDLKFPHHENEIVQSVIGYGLKEPVKYWMHNEFLMVDNSKMSKRFDNFYTLRDIEDKGYSALDLRFLFLQTHYRTPQNFTWKALEAAKSGLDHLCSQVRELGNEQGNINKEFKDKFIEVINDDLNISKGLAIVQELLRSDLSNEEKLATVLDFDKVLGLDLDKTGENKELPKEIKKLVKQRESARASKDFKESDRLRNEIEKLDYTVEDTKDGIRVYKK